ncbi:uncharacterized protein [Nicotiana tomentosiformis]|uniref:uncharacterized protein n=1 Tax=Nicotiana tomentosiformis TaxID=4098 RepID=UPI00388CAF06
MVGEKVLLKVLPMKGIMRFRKRGKLSLRFNGPFEVLERVGEVAYRLALPPILLRVHPLDESLGYEEEPIEIIDKYVRKLRCKIISAVKVQWKDQPIEEATWETEEDMQSRYPRLFGTPRMVGLVFEEFRLNSERLVP